MAAATSTRWDRSQIPDQSGRHIVVTGGNSGLGEVTSAALAAAGASVTIACRNMSKGEQAASSMEGDVSVRELDLADLTSVRAFAKGIGSVDVLVNNAGVMAVPHGTTADGFEMQIGTNHLGHFALTGLLLDRITDRVVTVSSNAHKPGRIRLDDLNWEHGRYQRWAAYSQTKLANLLFAYELQRRLTAAGSNVRSVAAHPGYAATNLQSHTDSIQDFFMKIGNAIIAQSAEQGALPTLYAATMPDVSGGDYYGPDGFLQNRGYPTKVSSTSASKDEEVAAKLWDMSEELTGVTYELGSRA
jgi:NAD(P)-dependent dehydrogenase (short-subunit alcohol dehydrogenase family)